MWETRTAYRFANGEVMGFRASGFTKASAERNAERRIVCKLAEIGEGYDSRRVITTEAQVNAEEFQQIQKDWRSA